MRESRPENYCDTVGEVGYSLGKEVSEPHPGTITAQNQTHTLEILCRKLCERVVCRPLRPQTGPDGGDDSKADTETSPVAEEILKRTFVGEATYGIQSWAFAFSAMEDWRVWSAYRHPRETASSMPNW